MITTSYGSWANHGDPSNVTVEGSVTDAINGGDSDWQERVEASGAFGRMVTDYRAAVNAALPEGVVLAGNEFIGPYEWSGPELNLTEVVKGVDLTAIIERHDPDRV